MSSPSVFARVIVLSSFNLAVRPLAASLMFATNSEYDEANATVALFTTKTPVIVKSPLALDVTVLKASATAPWTPVFKLIAVANCPAASSAEDKSAEKAVESIFSPLIFISVIARLVPL